jgi:hypothetical protein
MVLSAESQKEDEVLRSCNIENWNERRYKKTTMAMVSEKKLARMRHETAATLGFCLCPPFAWHDRWVEPPSRPHISLAVDESRLQRPIMLYSSHDGRSNCTNSSSIISVSPFHLEACNLPSRPCPRQIRGLCERQNNVTHIRWCHSHPYPPPAASRRSLDRSNSRRAASSRAAAHRSKCSRCCRGQRPETPCASRARSPMPGAESTSC